jgi:hypothetical protein
MRVIDSGLELRAVRRVAGTGIPKLTAGLEPAHAPREFTAPLLVVHSPHTRCGVREYGALLDQHLATHTRLDTVTCGEGHYIVQAARPGMGILVHFEVGIMPWRFADTVRACKDRGAKVVFCCHVWEPDAFAWDLPDAVVLHRQYPHPQARRGVLVPLGCPVYVRSEERRAAVRARMGWRTDDVVLTTVGMLAAWKRLPEVADKLCRAIEQSGSGELRVHMQTPWPFSGARDEEQALRSAAGRHPGVRIQVSTEFLPDADLLDLVAASDVGFLFHGKDTGSVSAATKQFVATRTPLVVTRSTHASDLVNGVVRVASHDVGEFARECVRVAQDRARRSSLAAGMQVEYERINMAAVARVYAGIFREMGVLPPESFELRAESVEVPR